MLAKERQERIMEIISFNKKIKISELVEKFNVSVETLRRDLDLLDRKGLVTKVHGGAILKPETLDFINFESRLKENTQEKTEISEKISSLIKEKDIIFINGGTTNIEIIKVLKNKFEELTIITNSLMIVNMLTTNIKYNTVLIGGQLNYKEFSFQGSLAEENIKSFTADKCIISSGGISLKHGITDYILEEVGLQKIMIKNSKEVIIAADHSKFETNSLGKVAELSDINFLVTDSNLDLEILKNYKDRGIKIL